MKNIQQLSRRLKFVADFITPGNILADIGTDHGFIPIHMVQTGVCPRAYAMDINRGPLQRADEHIREAGLEKLIETRLSDGLTQLRAKEAQTVLIAGMGGGLVVKILKEGVHALEGVKELILSPHTEADTVRSYLRETDFVIKSEGMVKDAGKYYVVIKAVYTDRGKGVLYENEEETKLTKNHMLHIKFGRILLENKDKILIEYLQKEKHTYSMIADNLSRNGSDAGINRKKEVELILRQIDKALQICS